MLLAQILGLYTLIALGFLRIGLKDIQYRSELRGTITAAWLWPLYQVPWRDWYHPGKHRESHAEPEPIDVSIGGWLSPA